MSHQLRPAIMIVIGLAFLLTGCEEATPVPKVFIVTGTVTYQDKPVAGALVTFLPVMQGPTWLPASGLSDAAGQFRLKTIVPPEKELNGAIPGDYQIIVTKMEPSLTAEEIAKLKADGKPVPVPRNVLPEKFSKPQQTGWRRTVRPGHKNDFEIRVTD